MKIAVLGGTRFIGRALVAELVEARHSVLLVHRGRHEPEELAGLPHLHADRGELDRHRQSLASFAPDAVADLSAMTEHDATTAVEVFGDVRLVVASSIDVYRAFASVYDGSITDPVPLLRRARYGAVHLLTRGRSMAGILTRPPTRRSMSSGSTFAMAAPSVACQWSTGNTTTSTARNSFWGGFALAASGYRSGREIGCGRGAT